MTRSFFKVAAAAVVAVATVSTSAQAQAGVFNFGNGQVRITTGGPTPADPLFIDFLSGGPPGTTIGLGTPGTFTTGSSTGIFAGIATGTATGTIQDVTISSGGAAIATNPAANGSQFLRIGAYTFALGPVVSGEVGEIVFGPITLSSTAGGALTNASLAVRGTVTGPNIPAGLGVFTGTITAQFSGTPQQVFQRANSGQLEITTFSGTFVANVVPEPSTYALMASGVLMLGVFARRRQQQA